LTLGGKYTNGIEIVVCIVILVFCVLFVLLLNYGAGRRRDWERDNVLQVKT